MDNPQYPCYPLTPCYFKAETCSRLGFSRDGLWRLKGNNLKLLLHEFKTVITDDDSHKQRNNTDGVQKKRPIRLFMLCRVQTPPLIWALDGA